MFTNAQVALMAVTQTGNTIYTLNTAENYLNWLDARDKEREQ